MNMRALWATFLLNTIFTTAQMVGGVASNSLALISDTGTMFVDSATYAVNLVAEYYKEQLGGRGADVVEVVASIVSVVALIAVSVLIMHESILRLQAGPDPDKLLPSTPDRCGL